jgi:hypothetical protein
MEISTLKDRNVKSIGVDKVADFSIAPEAMGMFFQAFSDSLYSDKYGSVVREIASNCADSHTEAKVEKPIEIELIKNGAFSDADYELVFRDFGTGMSPETVKEIFSKYFSSTKRGDNTRIGGWGIGSKSPFAVTDLFTVITWHNNIRYTYLLHRGETAPEIQKVEETEHIRENGTEVRIPTRPAQLIDYIQAIKKQLIFFDNIRFINLDVPNTDKIVHGDSFVCVFDENKASRLSETCIYLGKVYYSINWDKVNRALIDAQTSGELCSYSEWSVTGVALKFEVGDLPVTLSRESIEYKEDTAQKIVQKILEVQKELRTLANTLSDETDDLLHCLGSRKESFFRLPGGYTFKVHRKIAQVSLTFLPFKGTPLKLPSQPFFEYYIEKYIEEDGSIKAIKQGYSRRGYRKGLTITDNSITDILEKKGKGNSNNGRNYSVIRYLKSEGKPKNTYITETLGTPVVLVGRREVPIKEWAEHLKMSQEVVPQWTDFYSKTIVKTIVKNLKAYRDFTPSEEWLDDYKSNKSTRKSPARQKEEEITLREMWVGHATSPTYTKRYIKVGELFNLKPAKGFIVYGTQEEEAELRKYHELGQAVTPTAIKCFKVAVGNLKYLKDVPFAFHVSEAHIPSERILRKIALKSAASELYGNVLLQYVRNKRIRDDLDILSTGFRGVGFPSSVQVPYFNEKTDFLIQNGKEFVSAFEVYERLKEFLSQSTISSILKPSPTPEERQIAQEYIKQELTPKQRLYGFY